MATKVALVIGHRIGSQGAENVSKGISEFEFNESLAFDIAKKLTSIGIAHEVIYRDTYKDLPDKINSVAPEMILSLHCNEYIEQPGQREATGTETLYYHSSEKSKALAETVQEKVCGALGLRDRGILPRHSEDRGGYLLFKTDAPCVICEPFFIDNDSDIQKVADNYEFLVTAFVNSIKETML